MRTANPWRLVLGLAAALAVTTAAAQGEREPTRPNPLLVAFYVPWEPPALASLKAHVQDIDVFSPMWGSVVSTHGDLRWESDPEARAVLAAAPRRPKVIPIVTNAHDDVWDKAAAQAVILNPVAGQAFDEALARQAQIDGFAGYVMDFENLTPQATAGFPAFLARVRKRMNAVGKEVWVTTTLTAEDGLGPDLADNADAVVLMAYDQCWGTSTPGPIAADAWLQANLKTKIGEGNPRRYIVALAGYGYDWPQGRKAEVIAVSAAQALAARSHRPVEHPAGSGAHLAYQAANGARHDVWWLDAADFARQRAIANQARVRGVAVWRMGLEDSALWTAPSAAPPVAAGPTATCEPLKAG